MINWSSKSSLFFNEILLKFCIYGRFSMSKIVTSAAGFIRFLMLTGMPFKLSLGYIKTDTLLLARKDSSEYMKAHSNLYSSL